MAKKRKKLSKSGSREVSSLNEQAQRLLTELEHARDSIIGSIGKSTTELGDAISDATRTAADTSTVRVEQVVAEVKDLGDRVLRDLNESLESIKASVSGNDEPAKKKGKKGKSKKKDRKKGAVGKK